MDKVRVILFGMTGFGNNSLKVLTKEPFIELIGIFTPKKESPPFPYYKCRKIQEAAISENILLYEGLSLKENKTYELIKSLKPDLIIVSSFKQIILRNIISIPRLGVVNIHPSLLPKYRGPTPVIWALMNKEKETGVTIHFIEDEKIDSGRIITQARLRILKSDTDSLLRKKLAILSEKVLASALKLIVRKDKIVFPKQKESEATIYPKCSIKGAYGFKSDEALKFPRMVIAGISFACNARCTHCIYNSFPETKLETAGKKDFMEFKTFKRIADESVRYPGALLRLVGFGEPMLNPDFFKMVAYAKKLGCNVGTITNGSILNQENAERLLRLNIDAVDISVDAYSEEKYKRVRAGLDFNNLKKNVKGFVALRNKMKKKTFIFCSIVEQDEIIGELGDALKYWGDIADKAVSRKFLTFGLFRHDNSRRPYYKKRIPCPLIFERINVDVNGVIRLCGYDSRGITDFGNVMDSNSSIYNAWHSKELNDIRSGHLAGKFKNLGLCKTCRDWPFHSWKVNYLTGSFGKKGG